MKRFLSLFNKGSTIVLFVAALIVMAVIIAIPQSASAIAAINDIAITAQTEYTTVAGADPELGALVPPELGSELAAHHLVEFTQVMGSHSMHRDAYEELWQVLLPWVTSEV